MASTTESSPLIGNGHDNHASYVADATSNPQQKDSNFVPSSNNNKNRPQPPPSSFLSSSIRHLSSRIRHHFGSIGKLGSLSICVNFLTGPAMLDLPATFQRSGIIPTTFCILFVSTLAALCAKHMANAISKVPGNDKFELQMEYSQAFSRLFSTIIAPSSSHQSSPSSSSARSSKRRQGQTSRILFLYTQVAFFGCVTCLNISSLVDSAQVLDTLLAHLTGATYALQFTTSFHNNNNNNNNNSSRIGSSSRSGSPIPIRVELMEWSYSSCSPEDLIHGDCLPFSTPPPTFPSLYIGGDDGDDDVNNVRLVVEQEGVLFTAGYLLNVVLFMPLALMNLKVRE
jgi:hypothetical protein